MKKILLLLLISTSCCTAMEKIWHHTDPGSCPTPRKPQAMITIPNNGGSLDWLPIEIIAHITCFILTDYNPHGSFYYKCGRIIGLLTASKRYYNSSLLAKSLIQQTAYGEGELGPIGACLSLRTPQSMLWLKNWLQNPENMPLGGRALRKYIDTNTNMIGFVTYRVTTDKLLSNKKMITMLVNAGVPIDSPNKKGRTAFMKACLRNEIELRDFLIQRGANVNACDNKGRNLQYYKEKNGFSVYE